MVFLSLDSFTQFAATLRIFFREIIQMCVVNSEFHSDFSTRYF